MKYHCLLNKKKYKMGIKEMKKEIGYHIGSMTVIKFIFGFEFADRCDINEKWPELPLLSLIM